MKSENQNVSNGEEVSKNDQETTRKTWQPMKLTYAGEARDIVRGGGGKVGIAQADMGDTNKPKGQG